MILQLFNKGYDIFNSYLFLYLLFVIIGGFFILIKGSDLFVDGSSHIAQRFNIPSVIIGLTIVSIGTSAPEASVSVLSALAGSNDIAVSNVVGSNIFNILVVLGISSFLSPISIDNTIIKRDLPINVFSVFLLLFLSIFSTVTAKFRFSLSRIDGFILLLVFLAYMIILIKNSSSSPNQSNNSLKQQSLKKIILLITVGLSSIFLGGKLVILASVSLAEKLNISDNLIGLTIVALGTSLPELVTSAVASIKGENELALGNIIGSNIFNVLLVLGLSSFICSIEGSYILIIDSALLLLITTIIYILSLHYRSISKKMGLSFFITYVIYLIYIIKR